MSKASEGPFSRVEVITSVQRRRRWSTAEKVRLVEEAMQPGMSVSYVARQAGISPSQLFAWKRRMLEGGYAAVQADEDVVGTSRVRDLEKRVRDLERLLGRKTLENEILKEALEVARPKKTAVALAVLERSEGRFAVSAVAETLNVARSHINERRGTTPKPRGPYHKAEDAEVLPLIRTIIDARPTYGYRRVAALVNRQRRAEEKPPINAKRVLRIMRRNGLTLERHTARRPGRTHEGVVIALRSNVRWCSDHLEIHARNREVVRVLFVLDACDREIIAWLAVANAGISGEMVRDLMVTAVERRFGGTRTPHPVEWLSDNGSAYIAAQTGDTAIALGLAQIFTPVRSPESNGMSEAFVKTLKRDYARVTILPDAATILALMPAWIEDYCEIHPHSGLKFRSPREFIRLSA
ncbi:IS3 family transposase [Jiella sp. LLJ827]|uniref:IS3 family transposase n=1 Tax=Jiella sp. LLJ827 TaxID=2917712 RepID=UPI00210186A8|nr:IS3 family transposase [Jiella sp. LLJ827]MCQ0990647.1 IS3 family transposase [Jiella sp. LLJ827]